MQYEGRRQFLRWRNVLLVLIAGLALISGFRISTAARTEFGPIPQQDVIRLENRITQLEQRVFSLDSNLRNLEQQTRLSTARGRDLSSDDVTRLRLEVQALQQRLADHECALAKLDERTLSPAMRTARKKSGAVASDPCRLNFDTPLQLPDSRR